MKLTTLFLLAWVSLFSSLLQAETDSVKIDPAERRAAIRTALLQYVPLGSSSEKVRVFVKTRLLKEDQPMPEIEDLPANGSSAEASSKRGARRLKLDLGDYPNPSLLLLAPSFPFEESLTAQWAFDDQDHLIELFLDRVLKK